MLRAKGTDRILDILETLERAPEPISRNALAKLLGCPRSTVYSLVEQLLDRDWLSQHDDGTVTLGHRAGLMGLAYSKLSHFEAIAREVVARVATGAGMVTEINVIDSWQQLVLVSVTGSSQNYLRTQEGARYPLPITGSSRLQLVGIPTKTLRAKIGASDYRLGSGTVLPVEQFLAEIEQASRDGHYIARGLIDPYIGTAGVPIRNRAGDCVATLSIVLPQADLDLRQDELLATLHRGAAELTEHLRIVPWEMGDRARARLLQEPA